MDLNAKYTNFLDFSLSLINQISRANVIDSYKIICDEFIKYLEFDYAEFWLRDSKHTGLSASEIYYATDEITRIFAKVDKANVLFYGEGFPGLAWKFKKPLWFLNIQNHPDFIRKNEALKANLNTCIAIPILVEEYTDGVLLCFSKLVIEEDEELISNIHMLSYYIGLEVLKKQLDILNNPNFCNEDQSVEIISKIFSARDPYTTKHENSVKSLAMKLADYMNFTEVEKHDLGLASSLHDIGKIAIPMEILSKPSILSKEEYELVKTHVKTGYHLIKDLSYSNEVKRMVLEHHERNDGSGYPYGKKQDEIFIGSQLLAVADVVSAMLENRPYRVAHNKKTVIVELKKNGGITYNKEIVKHAIHILKLQE